MFKKTVNQKQYIQKFREEWKRNPKLGSWLLVDPSNKSRAYCRYCRCSIIAKLNPLLAHAESKKHCKRSESYDQITTDLQEYLNVSDINVINEGIFGGKNSSKVNRMNSNEEETKCLEDNDDETQYTLPMQYEVLDDNKLHTSKRSSISRWNLEEERSKAERDYYQIKSEYFIKMAENSRLQKAALVLKARKLQLEIQKMNDEE